ncbi:MAG: glycosidase [Candidatus Omnitrophica bacterium]|nr:glycosidase [Candidatus Omnitrophota bacterium]
MEEIFKRYEGNPILSPEKWTYPCNAVFNPGAIEFNGYVYLLCRVETFDGYSHLTIAKSKDGITNWEISEKPTLLPDQNFDEEKWGIEDPRITYLEDLKKYAITYVSFSPGGPLISLILTSDFKNFERKGALVPPEDKDGALFPKKFKGKYVLIHRPIIRGEGHIWISYSPDLIHWGEHKILLPVRPGMWDCHRVGLGCPPIETEDGWIIIYHGIRFTASIPIYRVGLALLDKEFPEKVIARTKDWVFAPEKDYERIGNAINVVFPTGYVFKRDKKELIIYYGTCDRCIAIAFVSVSDMLNLLKKNKI